MATTDTPPGRGGSVSFQAGKGGIATPSGLRGANGDILFNDPDGNPILTLRGDGAILVRGVQVEAGPVVVEAFRDFLRSTGMKLPGDRPPWWTRVGMFYERARRVVVRLLWRVRGRR
jgi:hypothetical protein